MWLAKKVLKLLHIMGSKDVFWLWKTPGISTSLKGTKQKITTAKSKHTIKMYNGAALIF